MKKSCLRIHGCSNHGDEEVIYDANENISIQILFKQDKGILNSIFGSVIQPDRKNLEFRSFKELKELLPGLGIDGQVDFELLSMVCLKMASFSNHPYEIPQELKEALNA